MGQLQRTDISDKRRSIDTRQLFINLREGSDDVRCGAMVKRRILSPSRSGKVESAAGNPC